jgi:hypothetical protein
MNPFNLFKRKLEPKPIRHYQPALTIDAKGILSAPIIPDWQTKLTPEETDGYIVEISNDRRN